MWIYLLIESSVCTERKCLQQMDKLFKNGIKQGESEIWLVNVSAIWITKQGDRWCDADLFLNRHPEMTAKEVIYLNTCMYMCLWRMWSFGLGLYRFLAPLLVLRLWLADIDSLINQSPRTRTRGQGGVWGMTHTHGLFWGHCYPCFGLLVMSPLGFKAKVGSILFAFCKGKCNVHSLISTPGATPTNLLTASITASHLPTCVFQ